MGCCTPTERRAIRQIPMKIHRMCAGGSLAQVDVVGILHLGGRCCSQQHPSHLSMSECMYQSTSPNTTLAVLAGSSRVKRALAVLIYRSQFIRRRGGTASGKPGGGAIPRDTQSSGMTPAYVLGCSAICDTSQALEIPLLSCEFHMAMSNARHVSSLCNTTT